MKLFSFFRLGALGCWLFTVFPLAASDHITSEEGTFFENQVRPVLAEHCYSCHSENAEKLKAGLRLEPQAVEPPRQVNPALFHPQKVF
ncbi:MAG: hypothetical protein AAF514_08280, partial [Verrucomicrobiota bacterium]